MTPTEATTVATARPDMATLLDRKMRVLGVKYRVGLGYGGFVLGEWMAYAELLEERVAELEAGRHGE